MSDLFNELRIKELELRVLTLEINDIKRQLGQPIYYQQSPYQQGPQHYQPQPPPVTNLAEAREIARFERQRKKEEAIEAKRRAKEIPPEAIVLPRELDPDVAEIDGDTFNALMTVGADTLTEFSEVPPEVEQQILAELEAAQRGEFAEMEDEIMKEALAAERELAEDEFADDDETKD